MGKQKPAAAAGAVATGPVPRPPVLEHTTAELVSLIASPSEREDFTVPFAPGTLAQQRVGISVPGPRFNADRATTMSFVLNGEGADLPKSLTHGIKIEKGALNKLCGTVHTEPVVVLAPTD